jgi:hypothetical protein
MQFLIISLIFNFILSIVYFQMLVDQYSHVQNFVFFPQKPHNLKLTKFIIFVKVNNQYMQSS